MTDKRITTATSSLLNGNDSFEVWQDAYSGLRFEITSGGTSMKFRLEDFDVEKMALDLLGYEIDRRAARKIEMLDNQVKRRKSLIEEIRNWKE